MEGPPPLPGRRRRVAIIAALAALLVAVVVAAWPRTHHVAPPTGTGADVEVVDEDGRRIVDGDLDLELADPFDVERALANIDHVGRRPLSKDGPVAIRDLPHALDGVEMKVVVRAEGLPPSAPVTFKPVAGRISTVRVVVERARTVDVRVLDAETGAPIAAASVVSTTEVQRRQSKPAGVRGVVGPGSAVTDADGRCMLGGLGLGEHELEVDAAGHLRSEVKWTTGPLVVRLTPRHGAGTVTVTVLGPDRRPAAGMGVLLSDTDRSIATDADGRAVFDDVAAGRAWLTLDVVGLIRRPDAQRWSEGFQHGLVLFAKAQVEDRGASEAVLGFADTWTSTVRVVDESDAPVAALHVRIEGTNRCVEGDTGPDGRVVFTELPPGEYQDFVDLASGTTWRWTYHLVGLGRPAECMLTVGAATIRGRVVVGPARDGVAGVDVEACGHGVGSTKTGADGRFALTGVPRGTLQVVALGAPGGRRAPDVHVDVPPDAADVVLELVDCGRIIARFPSAPAPAPGGTSVGAHRPEDAPERRHPLTPSAVETEWTAESVLPGAYDVEVRVGDRVARFPVEVVGGKTTVVDVKAP